MFYGKCPRVFLRAYINGLLTFLKNPHLGRYSQLFVLFVNYEWPE